MYVQIVSQKKQQYFSTTVYLVECTLFVQQVNNIWQIKRGIFVKYCVNIGQILCTCWNASIHNDWLLRTFAFQQVHNIWQIEIHIFFQILCKHWSNIVYLLECKSTAGSLSVLCRCFSTPNSAAFLLHTPLLFYSTLCCFSTPHTDSDWDSKKG